MINRVENETTNSHGQYVANIIVRKLYVGATGAPPLLALKILEKNNNVSMAPFINELNSCDIFGSRLSLVVEVIRNQYEDVSGLIANVKQIFLKAYLKIQAFREALPDCLQNLF